MLAKVATHCMTKYYVIKTRASRGKVQLIAVHASFKIAFLTRSSLIIHNNVLQVISFVKLLEARRFKGAFNYKCIQKYLVNITRNEV